MRPHGDGDSGQTGCAAHERYLELYVDGEFVEEDRTEIERHLATCAACARAARQLAAFKAGLKAAAPRPPLPQGLRQRITDALGQ